MPTLPTDDDGKLVPYTAEQVAAMAIKRRGVGDDSHVTYHLGPDGSGCTRKFSCAWDERFKAAIYFAGAVTTYIDPDSGARKLSRMLPQVDPDYGWVCTKVELSPFKYLGTIANPVPGSEPLPEFYRCDFQATFEMVPFDVRTDGEVAEDPLGEQIRYVTWPGYVGAEITADAKYIGLPGSALQFATNDGVTRPAGTPVPFAVGFVEGASKFKIVLRRWPKEVWGPTAAMFLRVIGTETTRGYIGALNKTTFRGYPPLSLQLLGVEQRLLPDATGLGYSWDIGYVIQQTSKPYGFAGYYFHDTAAVSSKSGYYEVLRPAAGKTTIAAASLGDNDSLFHVREFADLFTPGV